MPATALFLAAWAALAEAAAPPSPDAQIAAALIAALPADGMTDVVLIDHPAAPRAPRVRVATTVRAAPALVKAVLMDPARYKTIIPGLVRYDVGGAPGAAFALTWELEVPLFNLEGRLLVRERPDGVQMDLVEGDLAPGRITFSILPRPGGSTLMIDAQLDVENSTWLLRRIMARSPVGQPAALTASAYVALRAVALRAERTDQAKAWRPGAAMAPPGLWTPDPRPLAAASLAVLRARGVVGMIARTPSERLGGVTALATIARPVATVAPRLADPASWRAFPGWGTVRVLPGPTGPGAEVEDNLPMADFDSTWAAEPGPMPRWSARLGEVQGARLGWDLAPGPTGRDTLATLLLYPRLEKTGRMGRRSIASEPLLEHGLAMGLAFANVTAMKAALEK